MKFEDIKENSNIYLYCGDLPTINQNYTKISSIGLSLYRSDNYHIRHDITNKFDLKDNSVDIIQSEDVMEHIEYCKLKDTINEIYRVLKPGGLFRLSMPDYRCDVLYNRSLKDKDGNIIFDSGGGGNYDSKNNKVINGGHVWFPKYESVKNLLDNTLFNNSNSSINYLHYYNEEGNSILKKIDYKLGFIKRTPDFDERIRNPCRPMSIIVDCVK